MRAKPELDGTTPAYAYIAAMYRPGKITESQKDISLHLENEWSIW